MTLQELECHWSWDDVMQAHAILDCLEEAEAKARKPKGKL